MSNNWGKLCEAIRTYTTGHPEHCPFREEKYFEDHMSEYLRYIFGWSKDEVKRQEVVKFGHDESKRSDLTLYFEGHPTIVFELKAFGKAIASEEIGQFFSYMKQLPTKFGIITNSVALQLYYRPLDKSGERREPCKVLSLRFDEDDANGKKLGKLLTRKTYDERELCQFCDELLAHKAEVGIPVSPFDESNPFMAEQMTRDLDDRIEVMINLYERWLADNEKESQYCADYLKGMQWARENLLDEVKLKSLTDKEYEALIRETPKHLLNLKYGFGTISLFSTLKPKLLHNSRKLFINAIHHLNTIPKKERFKVLQDLTSKPEYSIRGMKKAFWTEVIRCKYPDVPLFNEKTADFFTALGLYIGITFEEKIRNISYCYSRWQHFHKGEISMFELSHLEHFAKESEEGQRYMREKFNAVVGDSTY